MIEVIVKGHQDWWRVYREENGVLFIGLRQMRDKILLSDVISRRVRNETMGS